MMLNAQSPPDLLRQLSAIDISVPARTEGRTKDHVERWSICRFLGSYASTPLLEFPLRLLKRERPDFELQMRDQSVGIEITSALPEEWAKIQAKSETVNEEGIVFPPRIRPGDSRLGKQKIEAIARGEETGSGWFGDEPEQDWCDHIIDAFQKKKISLNKKAYQKYSRNFLVIYVNLPINSVN